MAYPNHGSFLKYFHPNQVIAGTGTKPMAAINTAAANGTHGEYICVLPCTVKRLQATVTLATVSTSVLPVITASKCTLPNAGGTVSTVGTLSIPDASSVGQTIYKPDLAVAFLPGQALQIKWTVGTGGSVAGEVVFSALCEEDPETYANNTLMIASA